MEKASAEDDAASRMAKAPIDFIIVALISSSARFRLRRM